MTSPLLAKHRPSSNDRNAAQGDAEEASTPKAEVVGALQDNLHALLVRPHCWLLIAFATHCQASCCKRQETACSCCGQMQSSTRKDAVQCKPS